MLLAVVNSIADKVAAQCSKMNVGTGEVFLTGGLCECGYLQGILEQSLALPCLRDRNADTQEPLGLRFAAEIYKTEEKRYDLF
mgnify:FL=1